jgi:hypothetical protein
MVIEDKEQNTANTPKHRIVPVIILKNSILYNMQKIILCKVHWIKPNEFEKSHIDQKPDKIPGYSMTIPFIKQYSCNCGHKLYTPD